MELAALLREVEGVPLAELVASPRWLVERASLLAEPMFAGRDALPPVLAERRRARESAMQVARWLWRRHQFLALDVEALAAELHEAGETLSRRLAGAESSADVAKELRGLAASLHGTIAAQVRASAGERPREVVCGEYAAMLQRDALGLGEERLRGPILDVGCGASASLVRALRAEGLAATGVDREAPEDVAIVSDWRSFPFGQDRWGTVISHHAFTLHFLHHHLGQSDQAYADAQVYRAILRSLRVGGRFVYVPGLPFIEPLLPAASFRCTRVRLPEAVGQALRALEEASGLDLEYAAHVERLA